MAFATANSPANRKPGDNAQTATPPQAQARQRQSPGKAEPRARQTPPARTRPPSVPDPTSACQSPRARQDRQRAPGRKPGSGALAEPSSGLRGANRAKQRVPRALAGPSSEFPRRRIVNLVQPWSKLTILRSLKAKTHDSSRYRKPIREQPTETSIPHFRDREKPSILTDNNQNRRFFASHAPHDSPAPCSTSSTPIIDLGDGGFLRQA